MGSKTIFCLVVLLALGGSAALTAEAASAARYTVAQCGWHVGQDANWAETSDDKFTSGSYCQTPASADPFEDVHLSSSTRGSTKSVSGTKYARWHWQAPPGTGIVTVHGQRWQVLGDNFEHRLGGVRGGDFTPFLQLAATDTVRRDFSQAFSPNADAFESRLLCAMPSDRFCSPANERMAGVRALTFTLDDSVSPAASVSGPASGASWMRGTKALNFSATDRGSGLLDSRTSIDGAVGPQTGFPCEMSLIAGEWRGTKMQPCRLSASGTHQINTATLSDGPHLLRHCAIDFAGNTGCAPDRTIHTDNTPPAAPAGMAVTGNGVWQRTDDFNAILAVPGQGIAAPVIANRYRVTGEGFDSGLAGSLSPNAIRDIRLPRAGEYRLTAWLVDAAGNQNPANSASATIRFDDIAPTAYLIDPTSEEPEVLRAGVSDSLSGIAGGSISVRRSGSDRWVGLPTVLSGSRSGQLVARFPSENFDAGTYLVRAVVRDGAGNSTTTVLRDNGSPMEIHAPLRMDASLNAHLQGGSRHGLSLRVPFRSHTRLVGRLTDKSGHGLAGEPLKVTEAPARGTRSRTRVHRVTTGPSGRFEFSFDRGPSRSIKVSFAGTPRYSPASAGPLSLKVSSLMTLAVTPKRLHNGDRVYFHGQVGMRGVRSPGRGSSVAIQYLDRGTGKWRPVMVTRTDRSGHYRAGYRFHYITGKARIRLRAKLLPPPMYPYEGAVSAPVEIEVAS